jgi:ABC-type transporter Mla maintaining outer membrane lipid asymmetry permease subunit MlaE
MEQVCHLKQELQPTALREACRVSSEVIQLKVVPPSCETQQVLVLLCALFLNWFTSKKQVTEHIQSLYTVFLKALALTDVKPVLWSFLLALKSECNLSDKQVADQLLLWETFAKH